MTASAPVPVVNLNDHAAAAAYLMEHADATAPCRPGRPMARQTGRNHSKADIVRAAAAGADLNDVRIRDLLAGQDELAMKAIAIGCGSSGVMQCGAF